MIYVIWHSEPIEAVLTELGTDRENGLATEEAADRLRESGRNIVDKPADLSFRHGIGRLFAQPSVWLLLAAAAVAAALAVHKTLTTYREGDWITPLVIAVLAVVRCLLVAFRAWRAERALPSMKALASPLVRVRRGGVQATVSAATLVCGDIVELSAGELIPADCRLLEAFQLHCDESTLTGDALPIEKSADATVSAIAPLPTRANMLFAGCTVLRGRAIAVVTATGNLSEAGKMALLRENEKDAALPMQATVARLGETLQTPILWGSLLVALVALFVDVPVLQALLLGFALAVAVMPEELPALASSVVTVAVRKMAKHGAVVSRPSVTEELGRTAVLCTNKTGSFTKNNMTLVRAYTGGRMVKLDQNRPPEDLHTLIQMAALCSSRIPTATEQAVLDYARMHGTDLADLASSFPRLGEIPFDADRRRMTVVHLVDGRNLVISMGAPADLLPLCHNVPSDIAESEEFMCAEALRVLAVAYRTVPEAPTECYAEELERDLTFLGLLGLSDPLHDDVPQAIATARKAGVRTVLFTNESLLTAMATARRAGLLTNRNQAIDGASLQDMTDDALVAVAKQCCVFSRISPADKQRLVTIWQERGLPVLVTGEGAEDMPALREAEISCGMARSGAEIATSTADLVLTDDRFGTLVDTVAAGRTVFVNLRKTVGIRLAHLLSLMLSALCSLLLFGQAPLSPAALLWTGGVSSLLLTSALGREATQRDTMALPPRGRREGFYAHGVFSLTACGVLLCALTLIAHRAAGITAAAAVLTLGQTALFLIARSTQPFPFTRFFHAPWAWFATLLSTALFLIPLTVPAFGTLLGLQPLTTAAWRTVGLLLAVLLLAAEIYKWVRFLLHQAAGRTESR